MNNFINVDNAHELMLSENFFLSEFLKTNSQHPNLFDAQNLINMTRLACLLMQPIRNAGGRVDVSSAHRAPKVNKDAGGEDGSYHQLSLACDFRSEFVWVTRSIVAELDGILRKALIYPSGRWHVSMFKLDDWIHEPRFFKKTATGYERISVDEAIIEDAKFH